MALLRFQILYIAANSHSLKLYLKDKRSSGEKEESEKEWRVT